MRRRKILVSVLYSLIIFVGALLPITPRGAEMTLAKDEVGQLWLQIIGRIDEGDDLKFKALLVDVIDRGEQITDVATFFSRRTNASCHEDWKIYSHHASADRRTVFGAGGAARTGRTRGPCKGWQHHGREGSI
jgi:hypothetical protein